MIEMRQYLPSQNRVDTEFNVIHRNNNVNRLINIRSKRKILISLIISFSLIILITFLVSYFLLIEHRENTDALSCLINMKTELEKNQTDFKDRDQILSIYLLTYNVNGKEPSESVDKLLALDTDRYDVYAVALEELPMLSLVWADVWKSELEKSFRRYDYVLLKKGISGLTEVFLFVRKKDLLKFYNIRIQTAALNNGLRFKGGVGIRFVYDQITIGFLGCHLTPHDENDGQRIKDLIYLNSEIDFGKYGKLNNQDVTFLLGDLNFRLNQILKNGSMEQEFRHIVEMIQEGNEHNFASLLHHDQIRNAIQKRNTVFIDYQEPPISFAPTFKFRIGSNCYDDKRRPAWTDRILHRNSLKSQLSKIIPIIANNTQMPSIDDIETKIENYHSLPEYKISDHKPVRQVAYIPLKAMKQAKIVLRKQKQNRTQFQRQPRSKSSRAKGNSVPKGRILVEAQCEDPHFQGLNKWKLVSDSPSPINSRKNSSSSSSSESSIDETSIATETLPDLKELWSNVMGPEILQPRFFIEFYHIPDWNETKRFIAHFRVVVEDENGTRKPVSINLPEVRRYLSVWDWVGIFPENFVSLDEFLTFSYPKFGSAIQAEEASDAMSTLMVSDQQQSGPPSHLAMGDHDQNQSYEDETSLEPNKSLTEPSTSFQDESSPTSTLSETQSGTETIESSSSQSATEDVLTVYFDENCPILAGRYVLVYVRQYGDVIGISDPFTIVKDIDLSSAI